MKRKFCNDQASLQVNEQTPKKPYVPPAIEEEVVFETLAAGCSRASTRRGCSAGSLRNSP